MIKLGDRAKDSISGLTGIVFGITEWLYGCRRIGLQPEKLGKDGKVQETQWFDEAQCRVVKATVIKFPTLSPGRFFPDPGTGGPDRHEETK